MGKALAAMVIASKRRSQRAEWGMWLAGIGPEVTLSLMVASEGLRGAMSSCRTRGRHYCSCSPETAQLLAVADRICRAFMAPLYNHNTMLRRLIAVFVLHFLICVGFSAAGVNPFLVVPQGTVAATQSDPSGPASPGAFSDADDHALMDDKGDLPDQLEPSTRVEAGAVQSTGEIPRRMNSSISAPDEPPHKPPRASGFFA